MYWFYATLLLFLLTAVIVGCGSNQNGQQMGAQTQDSTAVAAAKTDTAHYQYRAVCTTKEAHGGNEQIITRWMDDEKAMLTYAHEHERKEKGHAVRIDKRPKKTAAQ